MTPSLPLILAQTAPGNAQEAPPPAAVPEGDIESTTPIEGQHGGTVDPNAPPATPPAKPDMTFMWILIIGLVVFWIFVTSGQRKEKKKRAAMLSALKKGDRVQTVGGVLGTVVEVRENEVVVKVDENSNTRMRFARSAIQGVMEDKTE